MVAVAEGVARTVGVPAGVLVPAWIGVGDSSKVSAGVNVGAVVIVELGVHVAAKVGVGVAVWLDRGVCVATMTTDVEPGVRVPRRVVPSWIDRMPLPTMLQSSTLMTPNQIAILRRVRGWIFLPKTLKPLFTPLSSVQRAVWTDVDGYSQVNDRA